MSGRCRTGMLAAFFAAMAATSITQAKPVAIDTRCPAIPFAAANAAAVAMPSAADAWGGPRSGHEPTLSKRIADYRIHATLDPERHTVTGRQQLTWRNRSAQPVCTVYLHLYLNAFESEGSTFMTERSKPGFAFRSGMAFADADSGKMRLERVQQGGKDVPWRFVQPDGGPPTDRTVVRLDLPEPVAPGGSTRLDIDFFDQLPRIVARTGHAGSFHLVAQWFPKIGVLELPGERGATAPRWNVHEFHLHSEFYADFGHYDVTIDVPADYTVGATGELVERRVEGGRAIHRFVQGDVHDFAWTADKRTAPPLETTWSAPGGAPVRVRVLFPPEYADNAPVVMRATLDSLAYFADTLGPYPFRTVTAVIPPRGAEEAGGMEYPTFFTALGFHGYRPGGIEQYYLEFVTIHEFGHQYFQGILASNEFEEPMLDEGLNQFWGSRMLRDRGQRIGLLPGWLARWRLMPSIAPFELDRIGADLDRHGDPLGDNSWNRRSSASFGDVYARSSTMLEGIERQVGREAMARGMRLYYQRWKFRHPSLADFREALAEGSGRRDVVEAAFAQFVAAGKVVDDRIAEFRSTAEPGTGAPRYRTEVVVRRDGADVAQMLQVTFADGSREIVRFSGQQDEFRWHWTRPVPAVEVTLDPDRLHPMDRSLSDNTRTLEHDPRAARWAGSRAFAWAQTLLAWLVAG